ncbi:MULTISPECIES: hypothetical protein [Tsukamurella]|uniref:Uncharacterized protein n=2 Tax=Tsukamurella TaxID=2060 RepID=A0A5C5S6X2_9ACTN|nr:MULTISPECIES: hypothetical protein [Tsukamurella]NMD55436.1 hypothetical protein [Tsukamurella columbiensis]TWS30612.1 hypothetical protein FK530_01710 [Tsukamurella conjunctivitidis]
MPVRTARSLAVFMGLMTVLWSAMGLRPYPVAALIGAALGAAIVVGALLTARRGSPAPSEPAPRERRSRTVFRVAVAVEVAGALVAIIVLSRSGHQEYVMPAIALVVALHFFVFLIDQPGSTLHIATGTVGGAGAAAAIALMATGTVGRDGGHALAATALAACTFTYGAAFLRVITSITSGPSRA